MYEHRQIHGRISIYEAHMIVHSGVGIKQCVYWSAVLSAQSLLKIQEYAVSFVTDNLLQHHQQEQLYQRVLQKVASFLELTQLFRKLQAPLQCDIYQLQQSYQSYFFHKLFVHP